MLTRMVRISKMSYLNIQNRSQCSFGVEIWRVKCNGKCLKHMADASDCALALYHLKRAISINNELSKRVILYHQFAQTSNKSN